jgi:transglutaminase-like putative cysteine protease
MALPAAAAVGLVAMLGGPYLPRSGQEYDPREYVKAPPPQQRQAISPLDEVSAWLGAPGNVMFSVTASQPENWQIAVLNHFDGVTWTSTDDFVAAGARIPGAPGSRATRVAQRYTLGQLPGVWLPVADRPTSLSGVNADVDPASGAVTAATATFQGEKYSVVSKVRDYSAQQLADAVPATDAAANAAQGLPAVTTTGKQESPVTWFSRLTQRVVNGYSSPFQRAAAIQAWLQSDAKYSVKALPGHTYSQLEYFLATSKVGTSEQFACAFAVMARSIGLPTRVVVGFRPGSEVNGTWVVESGDVLVWPEIDFTGLGWVPFSPTPASADKSLKLNTVPTGVTQKKIQQAEKSAAAKTPGAGKGPNPTPHPRSSRPGHHHAGLPAWVYGSAAAGLVVVVYVSGALLVPVLRRRRRRRGSPAAQVRGAWRQSLESLRQVGLPDASTWTAEEVAAFGAGRVGADVHLTSLATLVNRAGYAAAPPSGAAADSAWRHADAVGVSVTRRTPWPRRVLRRLHPRSLNPRS